MEKKRDKTPKKAAGKIDDISTPAPDLSKPEVGKPSTLNGDERLVVKALMQVQAISVSAELESLKRLVPGMALRWHGWQLIAPETVPLQARLLVGLKAKVDEKMTLSRKISLMVMKGYDKQRSHVEHVAELADLARQVTEMDRGLKPTDLPVVEYSDPQIGELFVEIWQSDIRSVERGLQIACDAIKDVMLKIDDSINTGSVAIQTGLREVACELVNEWYDAIRDLKYEGIPEQLALDDGEMARNELEIMRQLRQNGASVQAAVSFAEMIHLIKYKANDENGAKLIELIIANAGDLENRNVTVQELEYKAGLCADCKGKDMCAHYERLSQAQVAPPVQVDNGTIGLGSPIGPGVNLQN